MRDGFRGRPATRTMWCDKEAVMSSSSTGSHPDKARQLTEDRGHSTPPATAEATFPSAHAAQAALHDREPATRRQAVRALRAYGTPAAWAAVVTALHDASFGVH